MKPNPICDIEDTETAWPRLVVMGLLLTAFGYQVLLIFGPIGRLLLYASSDDTFLYLNIGRYWARDGMPSFDGFTPTNGFQPPWGVLMAMLGLLVDESVTFARVACLVGCLFNLATGILLIPTGRLLGDRRIGYVAGA